MGVKFQRLPNSGLTVSAWSPGENIPPTQVHLLVEIPEIQGGVAVRLKTRHGIQSLIDTLIEYRDDVFGAAEDDPEN